MVWPSAWNPPKRRPKETRETKATVFSSHRCLDYALLWVRDAGPHPTLTLGTPGELRHTDVVFAIGSPSGLSRTVSRGIVSNPKAVLGGVEYIQTDAAISGGNSGGPMIDRHGRVVGINVMGMASQHGSVDAANFALPLDYIWNDLEEAWTRGMEDCLTSYYCRSCGHTEYAN